jgi:hypothetical protein
LQIVIDCVVEDQITQCSRFFAAAVVIRNLPLRALPHEVRGVTRLIVMRPLKEFVVVESTSV